jgi:hypothetical protein
MEAVQEAPVETKKPRTVVLGLYATFDGEDYDTLHAISQNQESLNKMLDDMDEEIRQMATWIIREVDIHFVVDKNLFKDVVIGKDPSGKNVYCGSMLTQNIDSYVEPELLNHHLYAFNKTRKQLGKERKILQSLVIIEKNEYKEYIHFRDGLSSEVIQQDVFYDEGVMNA